ncbi:MAG: 4'-phosphopantetheinyl transferase superfamily protein [Akkermansia sp.]|nr:4'-phosphopantetheinyl transferase superfamily protein [Akkermansia sp.]
MDYLCYNLSAIAASADDIRLLDAGEQEAYKRRGATFLKVRSLLKRELARRLNCAPETIRLEHSPHGKPYLPGNPVHFNLSHSGDLLCIAFDRSPVGIDIQQLRPRSATPALARRIMCPQQFDEWIQRGKSIDDFFVCWCAAESLVKQAATTIWQALDYPFLYRNGHIVPLFEQAPQTRLFTPSDGYFGAVSAINPDLSEQS